MEDKKSGIWARKGFGVVIGGSGELSVQKPVASNPRGVTNTMSKPAGVILVGRNGRPKSYILEPGACIRLPMSYRIAVYYVPIKDK